MPKFPPKPPICPRCGAKDFVYIRIERPLNLENMKLGCLCNQCRLLFTGEAWFDYADGAPGLSEEWTMAESGE